MKKNTLKQLIRLVILIIVAFGGYTAYDTYYDADTVKIANWNLQVFGTSKASNSDLMQTYTSIINDYDIIFIQEIRDKSGTAFTQLCSMLSNYSCVSSSRAGRSVSKEQYGVVYKHGINITSIRDFNPDSQDRWERPPVKIKFSINGYPLTAYNLHSKPSEVQEELEYLENAVMDSGNVLILGDLNADCSYYNNEKETEFDSWNWLIKDDEDTTVAKSDCAYDRIILNADATEEYHDYGIYKKSITKDVSDHYLVWVEMKVS